ncbi:MAG: Fur family transcriptional regulator, ferric uptake regulator [Clostridia bacterium]|nr:Fur family transcriptional regulator, ferric uptake regulator [Clostridia bacterium]
MDKLSDICQKLHKLDYKVTPQRRVILRTFMEHATKHLSAEDVYNIVKQKHPDIGLATVYRTLDLLSEIDILHKINFGDGPSRYELCQHKSHHHHHMICLQCGKVEEFDADLLESLEKQLTNKTGFQVVNHQLKFFGYCKKCLQK